MFNKNLEILKSWNYKSVFIRVIRVLRHLIHFSEWRFYNLCFYLFVAD